MANTLSKTGIINNNTIEAWQVSQSVDAFTGTVAYDITVSGSLTVTGSTNLSGSTTVVGGDLTARGFSSATASWATNVVNAPSKVSGSLLPLNGGSFLSFPLNFIIGSLEFPIASTSVSTPGIAALSGKQIGTDIFITVGVSSSYATSSMDYFPLVDSIGGSGQITFTMRTANNSATTPFFFHVIYK
jgi:hypothetical protein